MKAVFTFILLSATYLTNAQTLWLLVGKDSAYVSSEVYHEYAVRDKSGQYMLDSYSENGISFTRSTSVEYDTCYYQFFIIDQNDEVVGNIMDKSGFTPGDRRTEVIDGKELGIQSWRLLANPDILAEVMREPKNKACVIHVTLQ